jgi:hypothetical protein
MTSDGVELAVERADADMVGAARQHRWQSRGA